MDMQRKSTEILETTPRLLKIQIWTCFNKTQILSQLFQIAHLFIHGNRWLRMAIRVNNIDNRIDNLQTMVLQHTDIQLFIFQYLRRMIDKPSEGLDKLFFGSRNVIILRGEQKK
jgi:hypothetical protein